MRTSLLRLGRPCLFVAHVINTACTASRLCPIPVNSCCLTFPMSRRRFHGHSGFMLTAAQCSPPPADNVVLDHDSHGGLYSSNNAVRLQPLPAGLVPSSVRWLSWPMSCGCFEGLQQRCSQSFWKGNSSGNLGNLRVRLQRVWGAFQAPGNYGEDGISEVLSIALSSSRSVRPENAEQEREAFERTVDFLLSVPLLKKQHLAATSWSVCASSMTCRISFIF